MQSSPKINLFVSQHSAPWMQFMDKYYTLEQAEAISELSVGAWLTNIKKSVSQLMGVLEIGKLEDYNKDKAEWANKLKEALAEIDRLRTVEAETED